MTELTLLKVFLCLAFAIAPTMTNSFYLKDSRVYSVVHKVSLASASVGVVLNIGELTAVWPLFCVYGFLFYLKNESSNRLSKNGLVGSIPFVFSLISSLWFVAGSNDFRLLGYDPIWSFYASLHGAFLGWILIGCLAFLARRAASSPIYHWGCYLCFGFFALIALGIDGVLPTKPVGVVGISLLVPILIGHYALSLQREHKRSRFFAALSLTSIVASLTLAMLNEFWSAFPRLIAGLPVMVLVHGAVNALVAVPCFFLAIYGEVIKERGLVLARRP